MPFILLILLFPLKDSHPFWLDLEELEIYDSMVVTLTRYKDATYIVSPGDNRIVKVDNQGAPLAHYAAAGQGPLELQRPGMIGVNEQGVFIVTRLNTVICMDHDLKPTGESWPMLPFRVNSGMALGPDRFLVTGRLAPEPAALIELYRQNDSWEILRAYAPLPATPEARTLFPEYDNDVLFFYQGFLKGYPYNADQDTYEIKTFLYGERDREELLLTIRGDVHDAVPKADMLMATEVVAWKGGYVVVLKHSHKRKFVQSMLDLYDAKGKFLKRKPFENEIRIFPIQGASEDLLVDVAEAKGYRLSEVLKP